MRSRPAAHVLGLGLLMAVAACSQQQSADNAAVQEQEQGKSVVADTPASAPAPTAPSVESQLVSSAATYADSERKFIRTANARFRVHDVYRSALAIEDIVATQGGFVVKNEIRSEIEGVQSRSSGDGKVVELTTYTVNGALQVRVPSEKAQAFLRAIVGQIEFLDRRSFQALDAQFELLRQQLAQRRNQEAQQALGEATAEGGKLAQKADAIADRNDAKAGRDEALIAQKTFEDQVAFATIDLALYQPPQIRRSERLDVEAAIRREGPGFFARAGHALSVGWYGLLSAVVGLLRLWPLWLVLVPVVVLIRRQRKK